VKIYRVLLKLELSKGPSAMLEVLKGLDEDLKALQEAGLILDYGIQIQEENPQIIRLDEEASE
jgi:hypothetical protein